MLLPYNRCRRAASIVCDAQDVLSRGESRIEVQGVLALVDVRRAAVCRLHSACAVDACVYCAGLLACSVTLNEPPVTGIGSTCIILNGTYCCFVIGSLRCSTANAGLRFS